MPAQEALYEHQFDTAMSRSPRRKRTLIEALEPRLLFSATADIAVFDDGHTDAQYLSQAAQELDLVSVYMPDADEDRPLLMAASAAPAPVVSLVFVDRAVDDYEQLVADIRQQNSTGSLEIIYLETDANGVNQITQHLARYTQLDAIHIISHGSAGSVALGNSLLNADNLFAYEDQLKSWASALSDDADILIYGCDIAASVQGQEFLTQLAAWTSADVAASDDATGHQSLQGDWDLEFAVGKIEQGVIVSAAAQEAWVNILATTHYINIQDGNSAQSVSSTTSVGQSFIHYTGGSPYTVNQLSLQLRLDAGGANQDITIQLLDEGWNDATPLASQVINSNQLTSSFTWQTINFADQVLNDGQTYIVRVFTNNADGKVVLAHSDVNRWNNSEMIVNGTGNSNADLKLLVSYNDGNNQAPINTVPGAQTTGKDTPLTFSSLYGNQIQISDVDAFPNDVEVTLNASQGSFTLAQTTGLKFNTGDGTSDFYMIFRGSVDAVNAALSSITYTPVVGYTGGDSFNITTKDLGLNGNLQDSDSIPITITNSTDSVYVDTGAPANPALATTTLTQNQIGQSFSFPYNVSIDQISLLLSYDSSQEDPQTVTVELLSSWGGPVLATGTQVFSSVADIDYQWFDFVLNSEVAITGGQTYFFKVTTSAGASDTGVRASLFDPGNYAGGSFIVNGVDDTNGRDLAFKVANLNTANNAPVVSISAPNYNATEQVSLALHGTGISVSDADGDSLTLNFASSSAQVSFTADTGASGISIVGGNGSNNLQLSGSLAQLNNFLSGSGGATLFFRMEGDAPPASVPVTLVVGDGTDWKTEPVTFYITAVNEAPVNTVPGAQVINEDTDLIFSAANGNQIQIADVDAGDAHVRFSISVAHGVLTLSSIAGLSFSSGDGLADRSMVFTGTVSNINTALSTLYYTPDLNFSGADTLSITTNDLGNTGVGGALSDSDNVSITINPVNDAPSGFNWAIDTQEDTPLVLTAANFGFSDIENNNFIGVVISSLPAAGVLSLTGVGAVTLNQFITIADINAGKLVFTPAENENASNYAQIGFQVRDDGGTANGGVDTDPTPNTLTIDVSYVNDAPVNTVPGPITLNQNTTKGITGLSISDVDAYSFNVTVTLSVTHGVLAVSGGAASISGSGSNTVTLNGTLADINATLAAVVNYTPDTNYTGADVLTMNTSDNGNHGAGGVLTDVDTVSITVTPNSAPYVFDTLDNQRANINNPFVFTFPADSFKDDDGDPLTYTAQLNGGGALPGWLTFDGPSRTFSGTPGASDLGSIDIRVIANDGNGATTSDVFTLLVNRPPQLDNPIPNQNATEDSAFDFTFNANTFSDPDGHVLIYSANLVGGDPLPSWLNFDAANRRFTGTPTNDHVGVLSIEVSAVDKMPYGTISVGPVAAVDTFTLTVTNTNDAPTVSVALDDYYADEQTTINLHGTGISVADVDGDALTITLAAQWSNSNLAATVGTTGVVIVSGVNTKTLVLSGSAAQLNDLFAGNNGSTLTYRLSGNTPVATDVVTVTASDGSLIGSDTFTVNITAVNDAPVNSVPGAQITNEDTALVFSADNSNQIQVNDVDVGANDLEVTLSVTNGTLTLAGTTGLTFTTGDGTADSSLVFRGSQANVNSALAILTFNPTAHYNGGAVLSITTSDLGSVGTGGTLTDTDTVNITINSANDAPVVANPIPDQNATEDAAFNFQFASDTFNDVDVGDTLTYSAQLNGGGALPSWLSFNSATRTFSGTPTNDHVGPVSIDVIANDGNGGSVTDTFIITVANTNDAPTVANPIPDQNATEDSAFSFQFAANTFDDVDVGDSLTYSSQLNGGGALPSWLSFNSATRTFSGTPTNDHVGPVSIDVIASDGNGGSVTDTFTITVANTNDAPTVANLIPDQNATEDSAFNFQFAANTFNDVDAGDTLTYSAQLAGGGALPSWLSFNSATRTFSGTPTNDHVGPVSIDVIASDGNGGGVTDTFTITVANTNDAPVVANPILDQNATEDSVFSFQFAANTFNDVDLGDTLTYTAQLAGGGALPSWLSFNSATRTFSGTPTNDHVGPVSIDVIANDGNGGSVTDTFIITVANTNDAPTVANPIPDQNATEDAAFNFQFASDTFNDVDVGDTLTYSAQLAGGGALPGWLSFNAVTRTFSGTPTNDHVGPVSIDVIANDGNGGSVTDTFIITVANTNDAPTVANPIPDQNATEDAVFSFQFAANTFNDVDLGDTLTYTAQLGGGGALPSWLSFNAATRTFSGTPTNDHVGPVSIDVIASDGNGGSVTDTFTITVANTNDAPTVANPIPDQNATEDSAFSFQFASNTFNDVDVGDSLTYSSQLNGGGALPSWLSFDASTRTFSGTPTNDHVGPVSIDVIANDGNGGSVTDTFTITVANTNDAPTVANPIPDQNATEGSAFNFQFASDTFIDVDVGDTLTYSAQLNGGGALPSWLSFNAATRTFSGTPSNDHVGPVSIDVIANDGNGGSVSDTFTITVANTNDAPVVVNPIPDQNATEDSVFSFQFSANTFNDVDAGDTLTYSAQLGGGGALPSWLSFNAATRTFSGTPTNDHVGPVSIDVIASDGNGGSVTDTFTITVANTNDAPTVANLIPDQNATEDSAFNFQFAANTFNDVDAGDTLTYSAQLAGGGALPSWLSFNSATRTFSGTPANDHVGTVSIDVIASDGNGGSVTDTFDLTVVNVNDAPRAVGSVAPVNNVEDSAGDNVHLWALFSDDESAPNELRYSVVANTNPALFASTNINTQNGNLELRYAPNQYGSAQLTLRAQDPEGASVDLVLPVNIASVNDAPIALPMSDMTFVAGSQVAPVDMRTQFMDVEDGTALRYQLMENSNPGVVAIQLHPDTGVMTFTLVSKSAGESIVRMRAVDAQGDWVESSFKVTVVLPPVTAPETTQPTTPERPQP